METQTMPLYQNEPKHYSTLRQLVDQLSLCLLPQVVRQKILIVNDIQQELFVNTDKNILASVISSLLNITILHSQNSCIRVSAKYFGNITLVHVTNNDRSLEGVIAHSLKQIQPLAEKLGGCVEVTNNKTKGTTVAFTFNNNQLAVA